VQHFESDGKKISESAEKHLYIFACGLLEPKFVQIWLSPKFEESISMSQLHAPISVKIMNVQVVTYFLADTGCDCS
jgi:hypothetical protein